MTDAILEEEQYFEKTLPHIPHKEGLEKFLDNYTKIMKDRYGIN
jgi:hypothetical protein